jgi:hypothetical protein
MRRST